MVNWPYIAGFFDGEGCISQTGGQFRVTISQKLRLPLEKIQAFLIAEGIESKIKLSASKSRAVPMYNLTIFKKRAIEPFLTGVRPCLLVKKQQAEDLWRYLRLFPIRTKEKMNGGSGD